MLDTGLRARKKEQTRQHLLRVALDLFVEQGFDATTVEQIASAADVSPRTFFRYFAVKEDVLFGEQAGDAARHSETLVRHVRERPADASIASALGTALLELVQSYEADRETLLFRKRVIAATPALRTRALQHRDQWQDSVVAAVLEPDSERSAEIVLTTRVTVATTAAAMHAAIDVWLDSDGRADLTALVQRAFAHLSAGLDDAPARSSDSDRLQKATP